MHAWQLRRNVLRRDLRAAARELSAIAGQRAARANPAPRSRRFRPLSDAEAAAIVGTELLAQVAATVGALK